MHILDTCDLIKTDAFDRLPDSPAASDSIHLLLNCLNYFFFSCFLFRLFIFSENEHQRQLQSTLFHHIVQGHYNISVYYSVKL